MHIAAKEEWNKMAHFWFSMTDFIWEFANSNDNDNSNYNMHTVITYSTRRQDSLTDET